MSSLKLNTALGGSVTLLPENSTGIKMNSTIIAAIVRHALTAIGGALATQYSIDGATIEAIAGGFAAAAGLIWSVLEKTSRPKD